MAAFFRYGLALALVLGLSTAGAAADGQRVPLPDGRHLYLNCTGKGAPTVLLEGGYGADSGAWYQVQPVLARTARVCSYDRAGYGQSDAGPLPRDGRAVAKDLNQALRRAGIDGPFILVGHSIGALYVSLFADLRPSDIAGIVLADPSVAHQDRRFAATFGPGAGGNPQYNEAQKCLAAAEKGIVPASDPTLATCASDQKTLKNTLNVSQWRTLLSEADTMWGSTSDEVEAGRNFHGDVPLIVLTADGTYAGLPQPARQAVSDFWRKLHDGLAVRSSQGSNRLVFQSSHMMMFDRPDAICAAVTEIIAKARK
jgi:pimeloyl-ACP methyl ester carboxylesterase